MKLNHMVNTFCEIKIKFFSRKYSILSIKTEDKMSSSCIRTHEMFNMFFSCNSY